MQRPQNIMRDGLTSVMTPEVTIILLKPMICVVRCLLRYGTMVSILCTECEYMIPVGTAPQAGRCTPERPSITLIGPLVQNCVFLQR